MAKRSTPMYRCPSMSKTFSWCVALVLLIGCAPKKVESPLEKTAPAEIVRARELASEGEARAAQNAYETFLVGHPGTVEADLARLELGILHADLGRCQAAVPHFEQAQVSADRAIALHASLHLAACQLRLGDPDAALRTIEPIAGQRFSAEQQALLWDTALLACEQTGDAVVGLRVIESLVQSDADVSDRSRLDAVAKQLADRITIDEAALLFEELRVGDPPHSAVSMRLLRHALETQDAQWVAKAADALRAGPSIEDADVSLLVARADEFLYGNPYLIGALLPLSGRGREVGRQLLQGMQLAQLDEGGPELVVEDSGDSPTKAAAAVESLVDNQRVIAVLGPVSTRTTEAAARAVEHAGVPLVSFSASEDIVDAGDEVFRFLHSPRDELETLVTAARQRGLSRFVILYPDHGYGRTMERLFDQEVAAAGGLYCDGVPYPPGTKSFVEHVRAVLETDCDAILLADVADQVSLIAPTFAAEGAWSVADGIAPEHAERGIQFLLPSPSWSSSLLRRTQRYLQGALIVLPFHEGSDSTVGERFRTAYETRYGRAPGTFAAYGYDAYRMISAALRQGHQTRQSLVEALRAGVGVTPVTSVGSLSADRGPAGSPRLYEIRDGFLQPVN